MHPSSTHRRLYSTDIYVIGGQDGNGTSQTSIFEFDPKTANLTLAGRLPVGISNSGVADFAGKIYVVGGEETGGQIVDTIYQYSPIPYKAVHHKTSKK